MNVLTEQDRNISDMKLKTHDSSGTVGQSETINFWTYPSVSKVTNDLNNKENMTENSKIAKGNKMQKKTPVKKKMQKRLSSDDLPSPSPYNLRSSSKLSPIETPIELPRNSLHPSNNNNSKNTPVRVRQDSKHSDVQRFFAKKTTPKINKNRPAQRKTSLESSSSGHRIETEKVHPTTVIEEGSGLSTSVGNGVPDNSENQEDSVNQLLEVLHGFSEEELDRPLDSIDLNYDELLFPPINNDNIGSNNANKMAQPVDDRLRIDIPLKSVVGGDETASSSSATKMNAGIRIYNESRDLIQQKDYELNLYPLLENGELHVGVPKNPHEVVCIPGAAGWILEQIVKGNAVLRFQDAVNFIGGPNTYKFPTYEETSSPVVTPVAPPSINSALLKLEAWTQTTSELLGEQVIDESTQTIQEEDEEITILSHVVPAPTESKSSFNHREISTQTSPSKFVLLVSVKPNKTETDKGTEKTIEEISPEPDSSINISSLGSESYTEDTAGNSPAIITIPSSSDSSSSRSPSPKRRRRIKHRQKAVISVPRMRSGLPRQTCRQLREDPEAFNKRYPPSYPRESSDESSSDDSEIEIIM